MAASLFAGVELAPRDPIMGLTEAFNHDARSHKVNLGVGVYLNDEGKIPVLRAVAEAERQRAELPLPRGYLPIDGIPAYDLAVQQLLLGVDSPLIKEGKAITAQALGGTGGLKVGADLLRRVLPGSKVAISDPSWENHRAIFEYAGFEVITYPYYDAATRGLNVDAMIAGLKALPAEDRRRAARLLPQPDRRRPDPRAVARDPRRRARRRSRALPRHRVPGLRRRHRSRTAWPCACSPSPASRSWSPARSRRASRCTASASAR